MGFWRRRPKERRSVSESDGGQNLENVKISSGNLKEILKILGEPLTTNITKMRIGQKKKEYDFSIFDHFSLLSEHFCLLYFESFVSSDSFESFGSFVFFEYF